MLVQMHELSAHAAISGSQFLPTAHKKQAARVRVCNYMKFETGRNLLPVLKTVTRTAQLCVDISDCC